MHRFRACYLDQKLGGCRHDVGRSTLLSLNLVMLILCLVVILNPGAPSLIATYTWGVAGSCSGRKDSWSTCLWVSWLFSLVKLPVASMLTSLLHSLRTAPQSWQVTVTFFLSRSLWQCGQTSRSPPCWRGVLTVYVCGCAKRSVTPRT